MKKQEGSSYVTQCSSQLKNLGGAKKFGGAKMFDFRRIALFCLEKRLSKHKMATFSKNLGGYGPFGPPGYAYDVTYLKLETKYMAETSLQRVSSLLNMFFNGSCTMCKV